MVQKTHKQRLTRRVFPCQYKYRITARYSTLDEKHAFASLAMFNIQYLIKEYVCNFVPMYKTYTCIETKH